MVSVVVVVAAAALVWFGSVATWNLWQAKPATTISMTAASKFVAYDAFARLLASNATRRTLGLGD